MWTYGPSSPHVWPNDHIFSHSNNALRSHRIYCIPLSTLFLTIFSSFISIFRVFVFIFYSSHQSLCSHFYPARAVTMIMLKKKRKKMKSAVECMKNVNKKLNLYVTRRCDAHIRECCDVRPFVSIAYEHPLYVESYIILYIYIGYIS